MNIYICIDRDKPTEGVTIVQTRNGNARYRGIHLSAPDHTPAWEEAVAIDFPSARGYPLNAGAHVPREDFDQVASRWLQVRGTLPLPEELENASFQEQLEADLQVLENLTRLQPRLSGMIDYLKTKISDMADYLCPEEPEPFGNEDFLQRPRW